jgi:hypothetical protein
MCVLASVFSQAILQSLPYRKVKIRRVNASAAKVTGRKTVQLNIPL